jgi:3-methyladenine DNA glycosylase AlkD
VYARHGAGENFFGVAFANLYKLQKRIKVNQGVSVQLWNTGNTDAMSLATMIADPKQFDRPMLEEWLNGLTYYMLIDLFVRNIVTKSDHDDGLMNEWIRSDDEWIARAGWVKMAVKAGSDDESEDEYYIGILKRIQENIHQQKNRTKDAMNLALISIGLRNDYLHAEAEKAAKVIGKVVVDHGANIV